MSLLTVRTPIGGNLVSNCMPQVISSISACAKCDQNAEDREQDLVFSGLLSPEEDEKRGQ